MVVPLEYDVGSAPEICNFVFEKPTCEREYALYRWEEMVWEWRVEKGQEKQDEGRYSGEAYEKQVSCSTNGLGGMQAKDKTYPAFHPSSRHFPNR
jgi:hypothetical protein